jgi:prepilin-type N-terminal cleavage/methylation domain-containing protein
VYRPANRLRTDDGFTLIELLVSALLIVVVLSVIGGLMFSTMKAQGTVSTVTSATTQGQLVSSSIENGIRNASVGISPNAYKLTTPSGTDQLLIALVVGSGATITSTCSAWYYSASTQSIRFKNSASAITAPTAAALTSWTLLSTGVTPTAGSSIFALSGPSLSFAFRQAAANNSYVSFSSTISSRTGMTGSSPCF